MSVRRDTRTGRWFFRAWVNLSNGLRERISGTPGKGDFADLPNTKIGAQQAEKRAIAAFLTGTPLVGATAVKEETKEKTIREHAEVFIETYKPGQKPGERREKRRVLNTHLLPVFGDLKISELTQQKLDKYASEELSRIGARGEPITVKTVNNQLAVLSTMIKYVTGEKSKLRFKLDGMVGEIHAVDPYDVDGLLAAAENDLDRAIILLASEAGLRSGEIRGQQWTDVRDRQTTIRRALDKRTNEVTAPKHNKIRTVPLSSRLEQVLAKLPRRGLWLISDETGAPLSYDVMNDRVTALYLAANVARPPKPLHCLRHTFGTVMAKQVPLKTLSELMGHADIETTLRYIDVSEDDKRAAIAKVFGLGSRWAANSPRDLEARATS
jgi:integrase